MGFIGRHLFRELVKNKYTYVVGIDLKEGNDIRKLEPEHFKGIDYVFHMAAQAKVQQSIDKPVFTNSHNIEGTLNVLDCARKAGVKRVIYSASSSAYGDQDELPLREDMIPNPMSPYAIQKLVGEMYCKQFYELYGLETVSLRYFNVYGPEMPADSDYSACIARFLDFYKDNKYLPVYGGKQTRDFTYVGDVVQANMSAMISDNVGKGEVINIGSGEDYSIDQIAKAVSNNIKHLPQMKGEPMHTRADNTKAKELLGWEPTTNVIQWLTQFKKDLRNS